MFTRGVAHVGDVFTSASMYDRMVQVVTLGKQDRIYERAVRKIATASPTMVLDVGCGTGALTMALADRYRRADIRGIDPGADMIERAKTKAADRGLSIDFSTGTGQDLPFGDNSVDLMTFSLSLHHMPAADHEAVLAEARRVLRPGGEIFIMEFVPTGKLSTVLSMHGDHTHEHLPVDDMLAAAGFGRIDTGRVTKRLLGYYSAA